MTDEARSQFPVGSWCRLHKGSGQIWRVVIAPKIDHLVVVVRLSQEGWDALGLRTYACPVEAIIPATPTPEELRDWQEALASVGLALVEDVRPSVAPHRCPVCNGSRMVPAGLYSGAGMSTTAAATEPCKSCFGTGVVSR